MQLKSFGLKSILSIYLTYGRGYKVDFLKSYPGGLFQGGGRGLFEGEESVQIFKVSLTQDV